MDIVRQITAECYLPLTGMLLKQPAARAVVNINGCLLELLDTFRDGKKVIENLRSLFSEQRIEITGTGKYHPIFPLIRSDEVRRQLNLQEESLHCYFNVRKASETLFLPELAYWPEDTSVFRDHGYRWVIIDDISMKDLKPEIRTCLLNEKDNGIRLLVRDRDMSESLGRCAMRKFDINTPEEFITHARKRTGGEGLLVTVLDAEVFGHHQRGRWKLLEAIYDHPSIQSILVKDIPERFESTEVETVPASWSTQAADIVRQIYYPLWHHPQNRLHRLLWRLLDITLEEVRRRGSEAQNHTMDTLLSSCPFFWASCMPWWNGIIVEKTADNMFQLLSTLDDCPEKIIDETRDLRKEIYNEVAQLNRTGKAKEMQKAYIRHHNVKQEDIRHLVQID